MLEKISIDANASEPIFQQIVSRIEALITVGVIKPGDFLPSIRALALHCQVNPNTIAKAYTVLQNQNLVLPLRGMGLQVVEMGNKALRAKPLEALRNTTAAYVQTCRHLEFGADDILDVVRKALKD